MSRGQDVALREYAAAGERPAPQAWVGQGADALVLALGAAVVAAGLALRLAIAWQDLATLTTKVLPDDAFYYFLTADRVSNGQNITFDGFTLSNGYHPLWLFFLVPFYLLPGRSLPLHLALTASSLLDVVAALLIAAAVWRLTGNRIAGLFVLTFYLFLPQNVFASVNGVESALTVAILSGLVAAALVAPWFAWSQIVVGTMVPVSGESITWLLREHYDSFNPDATALDNVQHSVSYTRNVLLTRMPLLYLPSRPFAALMMAGVALALAHALLLARGAARQTTWRRLLMAALPVLAFAAVIVLNAAYRWSVRDWYFAWGMPTVALALGVLFNYGHGALTAAVARREPEASPAAIGAFLYGALLLLLFVAYLGPARDTWRTGYFPFQNDNLEAGLYLKEHVEPDARVASFNAGVIAYVSERAVVNIDGVVNPEAFEAMKEHRLLDYLRSVGVSYAADRDGAWYSVPAYVRPDDWSQSLWGEDPNASFRTVHLVGTPGLLPQMRVWRLVDDQQRDAAAGATRGWKGAFAW